MSGRAAARPPSHAFAQALDDRILRFTDARGQLAAGNRRRWLMPALFAGISAALVAWALVPLIPLAPSFNGLASIDLDLYLAAARRWVDGGSFYQAYQLQGPYTIAYGDILYPPVVLWLLVPFLVLPTILWWIVPLVVTTWGIARLRPSFVVWPLLALCIAWPPTAVRIASGNPVMWIVAALTLGVVVVGPAVLAFLKPSLFPFAFWGSHRRRWWLWLAVFVALCVPFGMMWRDWLVTVMNSQGGGLLYSAQELPMLFFPIIAWIGRRRVVLGPLDSASSVPG